MSESLRLPLVREVGPSLRPVLIVFPEELVPVISPDDRRLIAGLRHKHTR